MHLSKIFIFLNFEYTINDSQRFNNYTTDFDFGSDNLAFLDGFRRKDILRP